MTENQNHLTQKLKSKLGLFCNINKSHVFESPDVETIYEIPLVLHRQGFDAAICKRLGLRSKRHSNIKSLEKFIYRYKNPKSEINIAMCGKYNSLHDAYKSILEALIHAGVENIAKINKIKKIKDLNFVSLKNCGHLPHVDLPSISEKIIYDYFCV